MVEVRPKVLLVDDHPLMRRGVRELLARSGEYDIVKVGENGSW